MAETQTLQMYETTTKNEKEEEKLEHISEKKRIRHRKKLLYDSILRQMEFYFSDANLSKDRYLAKLVADDPFVPLDTFLRCNAINTLTSSPGDISRALRDSTFLELSTDGNSVRRKTPMQPYDADPRTIYVEGIPANADRDTLRKQFLSYGDVAYIALPKFKGSHRNKGYAFIEFSTAEEAQRCLSEFTKSGSKLATDMPPEELASIQTFEDECEEPPAKKSKKGDKKLNVNEGTKLPQLKYSNAQDDLADDDVIKDNDSKDDTPKIESESNENSQDEVSGRSRKKKQRKSAKSTGKSKKDLKGLQVLSKTEWKRLRNRYLNLLRTRAKAPPLNNSIVIPAQPTPTTTHIRFDDDT